MLTHRLTSSSPVREPRTDLSVDHPAALLLTRYAGSVGRVLREVLIAAAAGECAASELVGDTDPRRSRCVPPS
jgi:hypothetical protein